MKTKKASKLVSIPPKLRFTSTMLKEEKIKIKRVFPKYVKILNENIKSVVWKILKLFIVILKCSLIYIRFLRADFACHIHDSLEKCFKVKFNYVIR